MKQKSHKEILKELSNEKQKKKYKLYLSVSCYQKNDILLEKFKKQLSEHEIFFSDILLNDSPKSQLLYLNDNLHNCDALIIYAGGDYIDYLKYVMLEINRATEKNIKVISVYPLMPAIYKNNSNLMLPFESLDNFTIADCKEFVKDSLHDH